MVKCFKTVFTRWSVLVHPHNSPGLLELAMDKGVISTEDKNETIYEVEIELIEGTAQALLAFGAELSRQFPLLPEGKSKYYRGLVLAGLPVLNIIKSTTPWPSTAGTFLVEAVITALAAQTAYFGKQGLLHELRQGIEDAELINEIACLTGWQARRGHDAVQQFDDLSKKCRLTIKQWLKTDHK